jgi:cytochrome c553
MRFRVVFALALGLGCAAARVLAQQGGGMFLGSTEDVAIRYGTAPLDNPVVAVNQKLKDGTLRLALDGRGGYLTSALQALDIPVESQMLVFSATSLQARLINPDNPRALFFNDRVVLGYVRNGEILEVAAHDAAEGIVFYTLEQKAADAPQFRRVTTCLGCHLNADTLGVPGLLMFSTTPASDLRPVRSTTMDHRMPLKERWGGWFVTGSSGKAEHIGNRVPALDGQPSRELTSASGLFEPDGFRATTSDIAALMVFSHQTYMTNLLTRAGWEARWRGRPPRRRHERRRERGRRLHVVHR